MPFVQRRIHWLFEDVGGRDRVWGRNPARLSASLATGMRHVDATKSDPPAEKYTGEPGPEEPVETQCPRNRERSVSLFPG